MNSLLLRVSEHSSQPIETVVVIGAGSESSLAAVRNLGGKQLVLVEGHPQEAEKLSRWIRPEQGEKMWTLAITPGAATSASMYPCNNPRFSSISSPERLIEITPNFHFTDPIEVPAQSFDTCITSLQLDESANNLLLLDAPGVGARILATARPELLQLFTRIIVRDGAIKGLYQNDCSVEEAIQRLTTIGFESDTEAPDALYPQAAYLLVRHPERLARYRLERQLEMANDALAEAQSLANDDQATISRLKQQREKLIKEKDLLEQEKIKLIQLNEKLQNIVSEQQKNIDTITLKNNSLKEENSKFIRDLENFSQREQENKKEIQSLLHNKNLLEQEKSRISQLNERLQHIVTKQKKELENITKSIDDIQTQLKNREEYIHRLETHEKEQKYRQHLLQDELTKAEAQIELIKDLILHGSEF